MRVSECLVLVHAERALGLVHERRIVVRRRVVATAEGVADLLRVRLLALTELSAMVDQ